MRAIYSPYIKKLKFLSLRETKVFNDKILANYGIQVKLVSIHEGYMQALWFYIDDNN